MTERACQNGSNTGSMVVEPVRIYLTEQPLGTAEVYYWLCDSGHKHLICTCASFDEDKDCSHVAATQADVNASDGMLVIEFADNVSNEALTAVVEQGSAHDRRRFFIEYSKIGALG